MQAGALGNFVHQFPLGPERKTDERGIVRSELREDGAIGGVMTGVKHLFDVKRDPDLALQRPQMDGRHVLPVATQDNDWLDRQAAINIARRVPIGFADDLRRAAHDAAHQEGRHVQSLPARQIVAQDYRDLGIE